MDRLVRFMSIVLGGLALVAPGSIASAASGPTMIRDINTVPASSVPTDIVDVNGEAWFLACDAGFVRALYRSDGTPGGTTRVQDLGACAWSGSRNLFRIGSQLVISITRDRYFGYEEVWVVPDGGTPTALGTIRGAREFTDVRGTLMYLSRGNRLWKTDGTPDGTSLVIRFAPGDEVSELLAQDDALFLAVKGALWRSTDECCYDVVKDFGTDAEVWDLTIAGGRLYFRVKRSGVGVELWKSNGTPSGTKRVKDTFPGSPDAVGPLVAAADGTLFFTARDAAGVELWASEGTGPTTGRVADLLVGAGSSKPSDLTAGDGVVYFSATDGSTARGLYASDGTEVGTSRLRDGAPIHNRYSAFPDLATVGDALFFSARSPDGVELWRSDGTAGGTGQVADILPTGGSRPMDLAAVGDRLWFSAQDADHGREPWTTDGTSEGTRLVADLNTATVGSFPSALSRVGNRLVFSSTQTYDCVADELLSGGGCDPAQAAPNSTLWASEAAEGALRLGAITPRGNETPEGLVGFTTIASVAYFTADDGVHGMELWRSDGTPAGTTMVKDIVPGAGSSYLAEFTASGGRLFFTVDARLWVSDGTAAGTHRFQPIASRFVHDLTDVAGRLALVAVEGACEGPCDPDLRMWSTDGTAAGTSWFLPPGAAADPRSLTAVGDSLFFIAGYEGAELWVSDLTQAGTRLLKSTGRPSDGYSETGNGALTPVGDRLYFRASSLVDDETEGYRVVYELWTSDGTRVGTRRLYQEGPWGLGPKELTAVGDRLFFVSGVAWDIPAIYTSDGTAAGTTSSAEFFAGAEAGPRDLIAFGDAVYFSADEGAYGRELWRSDGGIGGTDLVAHINPSGSADPHSFVKIGNRLFFVADDGVHGQEVWRYIP